MDVDFSVRTDQACKFCLRQYMICVHDELPNIVYNHDISKYYLQWFENPDESD